LLVLSPFIWHRLFAAAALATADSTCPRMAPKIGPSRMVRSAGNQIPDLVRTRGLDTAAAADKPADVSARSPAAAPGLVVSAAYN
jgi:hypothetical protein